MPSTPPRYQIEECVLNSARGKSCRHDPQEPRGYFVFSDACFTGYTVAAYTPAGGSNARRMPPKGAEAALSAGQGKPLRISTTTLQGAAIEHREESKIESRRTQLACRKMQTQIRRVAKTCSEFTARIEEAETRISHLEDDIGSQKTTWEAMEKQLEDTQWKLTDLEDRLRRNNLRVLPEGVEGSDPRGFMVALFKEAFPDLHQWEWEREIQRAHRFPFNRAGISSTEEGGRPRAMLISLLNFQARQAVYDLA
ncbi:hypothetical protein NDU88_003039 [Pleurodeles waltl]|uniref:Uncharacterized protein n=1 Tax=Pleurodeles waltl TaxID=8319 RepID=A0AAV7QBP6_PLEWA|nr:hypothetical protein NDU88_003039 [Pleurodeles waltl]